MVFKLSHEARAHCLLMVISPVYGMFLIHIKFSTHLLSDRIDYGRVFEVYYLLSLSQGLAFSHIVPCLLVVFIDCPLGEPALCG